MPTPIGISAEKIIGGRFGKELKERKCDYCGETFLYKRPHNKRFCCRDCRKKDLIEYNKKYHAEYYKSNTDYVKSKTKEYRINNPEKYRDQKRRYHEKNRKKINQLAREYKKTRQEQDVGYYIMRTLRRRLAVALKRQSSIKSIKTIEMIGCSIEQLKSHLESQFKPGMTFRNHGEWHIDHIIPCAAFNLADPEQQKKCFHYTNLQPLWAIDNIKKGAKII